MNDCQNFIDQLEEEIKSAYENAEQAEEHGSKLYFLAMLGKIALAKSKLKTKIEIKKGNGKREYQHIDEETRRNMLTVAYCFSTYEHSSIYPDVSQNSSFDNAATLLNVKKRTLKSYRDIFDANNDNYRVGIKCELTPRLKAIKEELEQKSKEEVIELTKNILFS